MCEETDTVAKQANQQSTTPTSPKGANGDRWIKTQLSNWWRKKKKHPIHVSCSPPRHALTRQAQEQQHAHTFGKTKTPNSCSEGRRGLITDDRAPFSSKQASQSNTFRSRGKTTTSKDSNCNKATIARFCDVPDPKGLYVAATSPDKDDDMVTVTMRVNSNQDRLDGSSSSRATRGPIRTRTVAEDFGSKSVANKFSAACDKGHHQACHVSQHQLDHN
jgi:hypothetical protein